MTFMIIAIVILGLDIADASTEQSQEIRCRRCVLLVLAYWCTLEGASFERDRLIDGPPSPQVQQTSFQLGRNVVTTARLFQYEPYVRIRAPCTITSTHKMWACTTCGPLGLWMSPLWSICLRARISLSGSNTSQTNAARRAS